MAKQWSELPPRERGYIYVALLPTTASRLDRQAQARGIPNLVRGRRGTDYNAVIHALVAEVESLPWERIRAALVDGLPHVRPDAIDEALHSVGMPRNRRTEP